MSRLNLQKYIERLPIWRGIVAWSRTHSLPGFGRLPVYQVISFIREELREEALVTRANSMAFSFFLSVFPATIVLFTVLAYTPMYGLFSQTLREYINSVMPGNAGKLVFETITDIATIQRGGLLSLGFLLAIWFSSNGILSMIKGFEKDYEDSFIQRNAWQKRWVAVRLTFILAGALVTSVVVITAGNKILHAIFGIFNLSFVTQAIIYVFKWLVTIGLFYTAISVIYRQAGGLKRKLVFLNPGAILATILSLLSSFGFSFYVEHFNAYNKVYGSIGTLIVLLIWLQMNCFILLVGFELNASIAVNRDRRRKLRLQFEESKLAEPDNAVDKGK